MIEKKFSSAVATSGRVIAARIHPSLDVLETIEEICNTYDVKYGQISACIGSLSEINMNYVSTAKPIQGQGYTTKMKLEGAFSVLSGQGLVSPSEIEGQLNTHLHFVVSGQHDAIYGGHVEKGTKTLTTLDLFITELVGLEIKRDKDPITGAVVTTFLESL